MGLRSAIDRLKRRVKRRRAWLMASMLVVAALLTLIYMNNLAPSEEFSAAPGGDIPVAMMLDEAYFSLDSAHTLTLYQGKPGFGKAVRLYFQMDMDHLRRTMPEERIAELIAGIPVSDYEEYSSVLSTFSNYALDAAAATE